MSKNILLIGKYPPVQGGIAAKTYWLYEQLKSRGYNNQVVTTEIKNYSNKEIAREESVHIIPSKEIPWHLPHSDLIYDRLLNESLEVVKTFNPDIIETNYLWPFCSIAISLSQQLNRPLLIRHAGSDIQKFKSDNEFRGIIGRYLNHAKKIVTNNTCISFIYELCEDKSKVVLLPRYIPDPYVFKENKNEKEYDILFAGKINYFWKQKGLNLLLSVIQERGLKALFIIGGNYLGEILKIIEENGLKEKVKIINFVHPKEMSKFINQCKSVWCWESHDAIEDFSNLLWEACFCNVKCIINSDRKKGKELDFIMKNFPGVIEMYNSSDILKLKPCESDHIEYERDQVELLYLHQNYIDQNIELYDTLLK